MKSFSETLIYRRLRSLIALSLAAALLNLSATAAFASRPGSAVVFGTIKVSGVVIVNDVHALSGQTVFSGSKIITASRSNSSWS